MDRKTAAVRELKAREQIATQLAAQGQTLAELLTAVTGLTAAVLAKPAAPARTGPPRG